MEFRKCFQCNSELPFSASSSSTKCPFCGAVNESPLSPKINTKSTRKKKIQNKSDDSSILDSIIGSNLSDSGSGDESC